VALGVLYLSCWLASPSYRGVEHSSRGQAYTLVLVVGVSGHFFIGPNDGVASSLPLVLNAVSLLLARAY